jgi:hypothetical protein
VGVRIESGPHTYRLDLSLRGPPVRGVILSTIVIIELKIIELRVRRRGSHSFSNADPHVVSASLTELDSAFAARAGGKFGAAGRHSFDRMLVKLREPLRTTLHPSACIPIAGHTKLSSATSFRSRNDRYRKVASSVSDLVDGQASFPDLAAIVCRSPNEGSAFAQHNFPLLSWD